MKHAVGACAACLCALPLTVSAATYVVRPDGSGDFPTIQAAVDAVVDGDVIILASGLYTGAGNKDIDFLGKSITVRSEGDIPSSCVINCQDEGRGFRFTSGEDSTAVLQGITVRAGHPAGGYPEDSGGAVLCLNGSSPTLRNCRFLSCQAVHGGALHASGGALILEDCLFQDNVGEYGGGVSCFYTDLQFRGCRFVRNRAYPYGAGGLYTHGNTVRLEDCEFLANWCFDCGGGYFSHESAAVALRCEFRDNWADLYGGGWCHAYGTTTISECTFAADTASLRFGGGLTLWLGTHDVDRCTFHANAAGEGGGGIGCYDASATVNNSIIAFSTQGEGVYVPGGSCPALRCCDLFGNAGGDYVGCVADQYDPILYGNICDDPLFCDPENGDFRLQADSPCAPFTPQNPTCDLVGAWPVGCGGSGVLGDDPGGHGDLRRGAQIGVQPNPCRDGARIQWRMPRAADTTLRLSTIAGRIVLTQRLGHLDAGVHALDWRAVDTRGAPLPCGVYLLDLSSAAQRDVRRVLVIR